MLKKNRTMKIKCINRDMQMKTMMICQFTLSKVARMGRLDRTKI